MDDKTCWHNKIQRSYCCSNASTFTEIVIQSYHTWVKYVREELEPSSLLSMCFWTLSMTLSSCRKCTSCFVGWTFTSTFCGAISKLWPLDRISEHKNAFNHVEYKQLHLYLPEIKKRVRVLRQICSVNCLDCFLQSTRLHQTIWEITEHILHLTKC